MKDKISIIVPVYKVEQYLRKCVDSIIKQTYSNLEIILIDDGSPDDCPIICDEYAMKDNRVVVIHKKNGGLSDARNVGIAKATGKYITFVDSDDYIASDYIEYLYKLILSANGDVSIVLPQIFYDNQEQVAISNKKESIRIYDSKSALLTMLYQKEFDTSAWGKLYSKKIFEDVVFPVGNIYEDISTIYKTLLKSKVVVYSNQKKYYYLKRNDSIMGRSFKEKDMDYIYQAESMYNSIKDIDKEIEVAARCRLINANFSVLKKIYKYDKKNKNLKLIISNIKSIRKGILFNKKVRVKTRVAVLFSYFI
ncbi:glycosyltransferase family 2 protein [bacterium]|nr:glycosyltransferase family 2 protein [bacterium]